MEETNSLIHQRLAKLKALRERGIDPFRNRFTPTEKCADARANYAEGREVALAGRVSAHRDMGKSMFIDIKDQSGRIQVYAQKNVLGEEQFEVFRHLDLGDFLGVKGTLFTTKTGEISVKISSFVILAKALRPPPEKWHGLADTETRYRQRYLDLMANDEVKRIFLLRSQIIHEIRAFLHSRGYVEVETPMMQAIPGGAAAQPFVTHHNALGCNFYLRIALELYLKRLLVGGVDRVFEIGRIFRNEGLSRKHNPEFTMLEAYEAYGDYESMMDLVQSMICHVAQKVVGTLLIPRNRNHELSSKLNLCLVELRHEGLMPLVRVNQLSELDLAKATNWIKQEQDEIGRLIDAIGNRPYWELAQDALRVTGVAEEKLFGQEASKSGLFHRTGHPLQQAKDCFERIRSGLAPFTNEPHTINLMPPWRRAKYRDLVREKAGDDWFQLTPAQRRVNAVKLGSEIGEAYEDFEVTQAVFEKLIEPTLIDPVFVTHAPKELIPLAKLSPDDPATVEVFECCINGAEIAPAYTEQNDPIQQRERLEHQAGGEQQKLDEDFLVALEHGMPPAGGMGLGIDRLCMMLLGQENIRDVILFPQMKPK